MFTVENHRLQTEQLFRGLDQDHQGSVDKQTILYRLQRAGIDHTHQLFTELFDQLTQLPEHARIDCALFAQLTEHHLKPLAKCLQGELIIPDFHSFCREIETIYHHTAQLQSGHIANYIPELAKADPTKFAVSLCTVDGQQFSIGDTNSGFCVQSICKPFIYNTALEQLGETKVHQHIGREPSGQAFNELTLNKKGLPHNPMINAGAIMAASLISADKGNADRLADMIGLWQRASGNLSGIGFSNATHVSELDPADRNYALGYFMRENQAFPPNTNLTQTLEFYFQCCSIELTTQALACSAATLANAGICPLTGQCVFAADTVKNCLSLMYSCGMYDFSGEWAFTIGLPAKSGVSGAIMVVIPDLLGLTIWSPPLDTLGNSVKGIHFCQQLLQTYAFHNYDSVLKYGDKRDPRRQQHGWQFNITLTLLDAASRGDLDEVLRLAAIGVDLSSADYDGRTALHLAAAEGHLPLVCYLIKQIDDIAPLDRWGNTPLDDAQRGRHSSIITLLSGSD
ncbi:MAG: glutaminase A [Legionellales bacterium]|nr:glutaminase A [Legionellales bacterium]